jgi:hypothetical protein
MKKLIFLVVLLSIFASCKQYNCSGPAIKKMMGVWYNKQVNFNKGWKLVNKEYSNAPDSFDIAQAGTQYCVVHYFVADCDKCINDLLHVQSFLEKNKGKYPNTSFLFIATGATDIYVRNAIKKSRFQFPLYFEQDFMAFKKINNFPLDDDLSNTLIMNKNGKLLLFGSFYDNEDAQQLYGDIINCPNE